MRARLGGGPDRGARAGVERKGAMETADRQQQPEGDVVFGHTVLGLLKVAEGRLDEEAQRRLAALDVVEGRLLPAYSLRVYREVMDLVRTSLFGALPEEEGYFQLGRAFLRSYERTPLGRTQLASLRLLGPRHALERMSRNFRTADSFTETHCRELGSGDYEVWFNRLSEPQYSRGLLTELLERAGGKNGSVQVQSHGPEGTVLRVRWATA